MCFFSIHCSSWVLPPNQFRQQQQKKYCYYSVLNMTYPPSLILLQSLPEIYKNQLIPGPGLVPPDIPQQSTEWVISWPPAKLINTTSDRLKSQLESSKILCHHLCTIKVHWSLWQIAHKQPMGPNNVSGCWQVYLFNDKAPFSITRYPFKTKSAGKSSWYESAVSPAITLQIFYQVI